MSGNDGLPPGWQMTTDPNTGRPYYINHNTMQTSWTPPVESPLPEGWEQLKDAEGRIFFVNHNTQETTWDDPRLSIEGSSNQTGRVSYPSLDRHGGSAATQSTNASTWNCPACTFENSLDADACGMCGKTRSGGQSPGFTEQSSPAYGPSDEIDAETAAAIAAAQAEDEYDYTQGLATRPSDVLPHMVPDDHSEICTLCARPFDWKSRRRHHCKCCGSLLCHDCSSRKVKFSVPGMKEKEHRVCDLCFDHQSAGDENCYLRYISILRDAGSSRAEDHELAVRGITDMIEKLPAGLCNDASVPAQAGAMRTVDNVERCGGVSQLFELLHDSSSTEIQLATSRLFLMMAKVSAIPSLHDGFLFSRSSLCRELSPGSVILDRLASLLSNESVSSEARKNVAQSLHILGENSQVQEGARESSILAYLVQNILDTNEQLQLWVTKAIGVLIQGNPRNITSLCNTSGISSLVLLLASSNSEIQLDAATALRWSLDPMNGSGEDILAQVRDIVVSQDGARAAVSLLRSENSKVANAGLKLIQFISNGQAEMVRAAGAVPLVVALLASRDTECQAGASTLLRNVAVSSQAGHHNVLESGGLSMALPLLFIQDETAKANAASLCEVYAGDDRGANIIMESDGIPALVSLVRSRTNEVRGPAAGALVELLQNGQQAKQAVVNAGGVEALLGLEDSSDPLVLRQLIGAVYSFVSDEALLESLTNRMSPATMAMKLLNLLGASVTGALDQASVEMLLLVVAVLCGARESDHEETDSALATPEQKAQRDQEQQTRELVASNGAPLIIPLLSSAQQQPALVLAAFRLLVSVCKSEKGAQGVAKAGGINAVVQALNDSLQIEGNSSETHQLVFQLRLYGLTLFGTLCGGNSSSGTLSTTSVDDIRVGVKAITKVLDDPGSVLHDEKQAIQVAAVHALRDLSCHSGNWETISSIALQQLIEILLADDSAPALLADIGHIISNLAKLEKHCETVLDAGAVFPLMGLLSEKESDAVSAGLTTLFALAESSRRCRIAIVEEGAPSKLLHIAEQRPEPLPVLALKCLLSLSQEPSNGPKITSDAGATDSLLRLMKSGNRELAELSLEVLLAVAKDSENLWEQLVVNADIDSSIALLKLGPPRVQGHAVSTIATLCGDSPGFALCASPTILETVPKLVSLLTPPEHLGSDKSESPAMEAAAACALLSNSPVAREALLEAKVIPALVALLLRERRLGRPRSASSEHTLVALHSFSKDATYFQDEGEAQNETLGHKDLSGSSPTQGFWHAIHKLGKRKETIDVIITVLDAHVRDASETPSGCDRFTLCEYAITLLGSLPQPLVPNEVTLIGRSARSINLLMSEAAPDSVLSACLVTLMRLASEPSLTPLLIAAGTIRSSSVLLEPLTKHGESEGSNVPLNTSVILQAARMIALLVGESADRSVDDAIMGTRTIPALAALITRTKELFPSPAHAEDALTAGLEAISSLAKGGAAVQKAIMSGESGPEVLAALATVVSNFEPREFVDNEAEAKDVDVTDEAEETRAEEGKDVDVAEEAENEDANEGKKKRKEIRKTPMAINATQNTLVNTADESVLRQRATHALLTMSRLATLDDHRMLIIESEPSILDLCERILSDREQAADLVEATVQLVRDLGPSVATQFPRIVGPLVSNILGNENFTCAWKPCLEALCAMSLDTVTATSLLDEYECVVDHLAAILSDNSKPSEGNEISELKISSATLLCTLAGALSSTTREKHEVLDKIITMCASSLLIPDAAKPSNAVLVTNALLTLNFLCLAPHARASIRKSQALLRAIRLLGTSPQVEVFTSNTAARVFATLGTGEKLVRHKAKPVPQQLQQPQASNAMPSAHSSGIATGGGAGSPTVPPPHVPKPAFEMPGRSNSMASSGSNSPSVSYRSKPPGGSASLGTTTMLPPPEKGTKSQLPTYSSSIGSSGFRQSPAARSSSADRESLELAQKLHAEEVRKAKSSSASSLFTTAAPPRPWNCSACTFENPPEAPICGMCEARRSDTPSNDLGSAGKVTVRCPTCRTTLAAPSSSETFMCMKCRSTANTMSHRV